MISRGVPVLFLALALVGCYEPRNEEALSGDEDVTRCATCHGDPTREGDALIRSAPPGDLSGNDASEYPGVGAHLLHVLGGETHAPIPCSECHVVPEGVNEAGHADDEGPAEVVFGPLAKTGNRDPSYHVAARRCSDTWCHQGGDAVWTKPKNTEASCGTCHGLPPALPHPQAENCGTCHGEVIDDEGVFVAPELHVNGRIEFEEPNCQTCHGDDVSAAPPKDVSGNEERNFVGVGAHRTHVMGTERSRAVACEECHVVPREVEDPLHVDGLPAEVLLAGIARTEMRNPGWDAATLTCANSWCHGPGASGFASSPVWTATQPLECNSCHGTPPEAPHPQMEDCSVCHDEVIDGSGQIISPALHVNGIVEVGVPTDCTSCHGSDGPAPPSDVAGNTETTFPGVGAHQTHVLGTSTSRAVPCGECHAVPVQATEAGHWDTFLPAEVLFSGVATSYGAPIEYDEGSCENSYCHGAVFFDGRKSGGTNTAPTWTTVDGSEAACGSCHGLPPPIGHPQSTDCASCHLNVRPDNVSFYDPTLHVNGITENYIP